MPPNTSWKDSQGCSSFDQPASWPSTAAGQESGSTVDMLIVFIGGFRSEACILHTVCLANDVKVSSCLLHLVTS
jgi:hypothetical protein